MRRVLCPFELGPTVVLQKGLRFATDVFDHLARDQVGDDDEAVLLDGGEEGGDLCFVHAMGSRGRRQPSLLVGEEFPL